MSDFGFSQLGRSILIGIDKLIAAQSEEAEKQREWQEKENQKARDFQAAENAKYKVRRDLGGGYPG